jgi:hypothetical protein
MTSHSTSPTDVAEYGLGKGKGPRYVPLLLVGRREGEPLGSAGRDGSSARCALTPSGAHGPQSSPTGLLPKIVGQW